MRRALTLVLAAVLAPRAAAAQASGRPAFSVGTDTPRIATSSLYVVGRDPRDTRVFA